MAKGRPELYDVLIVGAGPAGCAAARRARQLQRSVLLIEREPFPRPRACAGWLGPAGVELCAACGLTAKTAQAAPFAGLRLHSWDLKRTVEVADKGLHGWLVDRAAFDQALLRQARDAGADVLQKAGPEALALGEDRAVLRLSDGREAAGRLVLIADGADSPTARLANLAMLRQGIEPARCAYAVFESPKTAGALEVVIGASRAAQVAALARVGKQTRLMLLTRDYATPPEAQFAAFLEAAQAAKLVAGRPLAAPVFCPSPAGAALDIESHVGKRCLLIGAAGGFVAAFSNEGIYPAMKSGWLAAQAADRALKAAVPQDELNAFSADWRAELADYLRMPNTDLSLLMPLVFSNAQMSKRVAQAFLLGRKF